VYEDEAKERKNWLLPRVPTHILVVNKRKVASGWEGARVDT